MKGKGIYYSICALLGIFCALIDFLPFLFIFLMYAYVLYRCKSFSVKQMVCLIMVFLIFIIIGVTANTKNKTVLTGSEKLLSVQLQQWEIDGDQLKIAVKDEKTDEKLLLQYRIKSFQEKRKIESQLTYGSTCTINGQLETPSSSRNPNAFSYQQYLANKQIYWILTPDELSIRSCSHKKATLLSFTEKVRHQGIDYAKGNFPEPMASLAIALLFGERSFMSTELVSSYQKIGIVHLLAISGLQVSFLTGVLFLVGIRLGIVREKMIDILLVFLPFYALLTGATASVVRAVLMMLVILISLKVSNNRIQPLDALSIALLLSLFFGPFLIFDVGFQLTFIASASLLLSTVFLSNGQGPISQLLLTSMIAQMSTLPIILFHFYEFSVLSLLANFLFVSFFSVILTPFIFFVFILHPFFGVLFEPLLWITNQTISFANRLIEWLSLLPFQMITLGRPGVLLLLIYIVSITVVFFHWERTPKKVVKVTILLVLPILLQIIVNIMDPYGEITFIDVGQGDAIFIKLPYHQGKYLIDTGGIVPFGKEEWQEKNQSFEVGKDVIIPFIKSKGISSIDKLILTHGDYDHMGGAESVMEGLNVKEILLPKVKNQSDLEGEIINLAKRKAITITYVSEGAGWKIGTSHFQILSPPVEMEGVDKNNGSVVIYVKLGGLSWLFTGDMEEEMEKKLIKKHPSLQIDILKVGHHGSQSSTSEELLRQYHPEVAVISVGEKNRYGHPKPEVISRLQEHSVQILRTDQHGAITYIFKRGKGTFSVWIP
ncbi:DNA internalization-related competence protein ComEC/Rec2 [Bacillus sp. 1NLA3E]|uniref:DNA internalization-related competence protein ComEC/Rec2 n=1 Tax=Bacillus sp. 1NLA3E TaxID=666686 RepID=UPI000247F063|nr:DNA internalization-related competence protein ComEC/Rec2 [Bacillus sp. 1NLA3E]AGK54991.1 DNA internalization-related competence protein ComEC/Rec2 [Bacillus sp. 1NLA3E]